MQLHHVDRGQGPTVVFVHGTPSSSFEFRHAIDHLCTTHRCLAVDHLGFGKSPKPVDGDYSLRAHQERFEHFLDAHDVRDAVFVLHDFGAAIALPALWARPERCRGLVLLNTFLWPASGPMAWLLAFYATRLGQWVYRSFNVSAGLLLPYAWGKRRPLSPELHAAYQAPLSTPDDRRGTAALPGELIGPTLRDLEGQVAEVRRWPTRMVWGMADRLLGAAELARWRSALPQIVVDELPDVGHFVAEEAPEAVVAAVLASFADTTRESPLREAG